MSKVALVAGATGYIGSQVLDLLVADEKYHEIRVISRRKIHYDSQKIKTIVLDFDSLIENKEMVVGVDDVFCCLGTTIKKAKTKENFERVDFGYVVDLGIISKPHCERFLVVSAVGVSAGSPVFYNQVKGRMEKSLASINFKALHIFKPSILTGQRKEFRLGEKLGILLSKIISPVLMGKLSKYKGIEGKDVAMAMVSAAQTKKQGVFRYEYTDMQQLIQKSGKY